MSITLNFHAPNPRQTESWPSSRLADLGMTWLRARRWIIATAKKVLPVIAVFAVLAAVVAATLALRLAIWLPLYFRP